MSMRPRNPFTARPTHPGGAASRRRGIAALAAVAALLATAGVIGSASDSGGDRARSAQVMASDKASGADDSGGGRASNGPVPSADTGTLAEYDADVATEVATAPSGSGSDGTARDESAPRDLSVQPKIIRTGSVDLEVKKGTFADAIGDLTALASGVGGFVSASETTQLGDDPRGTITLRVPAKDFDRVLARVAKLGKVSGATTGSQDVTGEYTDVAARIKALKDEREQITLVLSRAETIPDILSVRDRLSAVQGELEQLQGRQQVLDDQTSLSTLTVSVGEQGRDKGPITTKPDPERTGLAKLWHDSADRFGDGVRSIALGFAVMAPWLLLGLVLWLPARALWRRLAVVAPAASEPVTATTAD